MTERKKKPRRERSRFEPPVSAFRVEIDPIPSGLSVMIGGVRLMDDFSSSDAVLQTPHGEILLHGENLLLSVFENKTVEIAGKVEEVRFVYRKAH